MSVVRGIVTVAAVCLAVALAGCGGGGGSTAAPPLLPAVPAQPAVAGPILSGLLSATGPNVVGATVGSANGSAILVAASTAIAAAGASAPMPASLIVNVGTAAHATALGAGRRPADAAAKAPPSDAALDASAVAAMARTRLIERLGRGAAALRRTASVQTIGTSRSFFLQAAVDGKTTYTATTLTLEATTAHARLWVDPALGLSASTVAAIAANVEGDAESDATHFGPATYSAQAAGLQRSYQTCDASGRPNGGSSPQFVADGDGTIDVLLTSSARIGDRGGYFSALDLAPQGIANCFGTAGDPSTTPQSNADPVVAIGYSASFGTDYEIREDTLRSAAHEIQHLTSYVNHVIVAGGTPEATWIDEGFAMLAQDFAVRAANPGVAGDVADAFTRAGQFLAEPQNYDLTGFYGIDSGTQPTFGASGTYGLAFLFQRYCYDRFGGDAYTRAMIASGLSGAANLTANDGGIPVATVLADFGVAIATPHAEGTGAFALPSLDLSASYADQFGNTLALSGPAPVASLAPGASTTIQALPGSFAYVTLAGIPAAGVPVTIANPDGTFALGGGIAP